MEEQFLVRNATMDKLSASTVLLLASGFGLGLAFASLFKRDKCAKGQLLLRVRDNPKHVQWKTAVASSNALWWIMSLHRMHKINMRARTLSHPVYVNMTPPLSLNLVVRVAPYWPLSNPTRFQTLVDALALRKWDAVKFYLECSGVLLKDMNACSAQSNPDALLTKEFALKLHERLSRTFGAVGLKVLECTVAEMDQHATAAAAETKSGPNPVFAVAGNVEQSNLMEDEASILEEHGRHLNSCTFSAAADDLPPFESGEAHTVG